MRGAYYCLFTAGLLLTAGVAALLPGAVLYGAEAVVLCVYMAGDGDGVSDWRAGHDKQSDGMEDV